MSCTCILCLFCDCQLITLLGFNHVNVYVLVVHVVPVCVQCTFVSKYIALHSQKSVWWVIMVMPELNILIIHMIHVHAQYDIVLFPECADMLERFLSNVTVTQSTTNASSLFNYTSLATDSTPMIPASGMSRSELLYRCLGGVLLAVVLLLVCITTVMLLRHRKNMSKKPLGCLDLGKEKKILSYTALVQDTHF